MRTSHLNLIWVRGFTTIMLKPHILKHHIPEHQTLPPPGQRCGSRARLSLAPFRAPLRCFGVRLCAQVCARRENFSHREDEGGERSEPPCSDEAKSTQPNMTPFSSAEFGGWPWVVLMIIRLSILFHIVCVGQYCGANDKQKPCARTRLGLRTSMT